MTDQAISEEMFERQSRRRSIIATAAFHLCLLLVMFFWTCANPGEPPAEELTEIMWGSGGNPNVNAPDGPATKGDPNAAQGGASMAAHSTPTPRTDPQKVKAPTTTSPTPDRIRSTDNVPRKPAAADRHATEGSATGSSGATSNGTTPNGSSSPAGDRPDGTGTTPAGGSGGSSVGSASGIGTRGWASRPHVVYPTGANATGTVVLRFTVMPNGDIVNITTVKRADGALVNAALAALRRARFRPLPSEAPQVSVTGTIPIYFKLDD